MPAITKEERMYLSAGGKVETAGQLNYLLTLLFHSYFTNYQAANDVAFVIDEAIFQLRTNDLVKFKPEESSGFTEDFEKIVNNADLSSKDIRGAIRSCYMEFYRMKVADYENKKYEINGKV